MPDVRTSRRADRRASTMQEITARALQQIAEGGVDNLSLNALARSMSMAPAALYRYFDSKDALLADLVVQTYEDLADVLEHAATRRGSARTRLRTVAHASRDWALDHPHAYRLIFQHSSGSGQQLEADRTIAAAQRSMDVFLGALAPLQPSMGALPRPLAQQIFRWGERSTVPGLPVDTLAAGLACWYRLQGIVGLEIGGHLSATGIDASLLYDAELDALLDRNA